MLTLYSTCPSSEGVSPEQFRRRVVAVARWSEMHGCVGQLVYTDNTLADPWLTAQLIIEHTERQLPMVAVQPCYMHPFNAARMISTLGFLYGRGVHLNLVSGGFALHLTALGDRLAHDERYDRLTEYTEILVRLLSDSGPVRHHGEFYRLAGVTLSPALPTRLRPRLFLAGSSEAAIRAAERVGATRLAYPHHTDDYDQRGVPRVAGSTGPLAGTGIRLGIIARGQSDDAWRVGRARFPVDRTGEEIHDAAAGVVQSIWHQRLSGQARANSSPRGAYWLYPFRAYRTFCPYLIGSYAEVAEQLRTYIHYGVSTLILDVPETEDDLYHASIAVGMATAATTTTMPADVRTASQ